jgi:hypothetical protein
MAKEVCCITTSITDYQVGRMRARSRYMATDTADPNTQRRHEDMAPVCRLMSNIRQTSLSRQDAHGFGGQRYLGPRCESSHKWYKLTIGAKSSTSRSHLCLLATPMGTGLEAVRRGITIRVEFDQHWVFTGLCYRPRKRYWNGCH